MFLRLLSLPARMGRWRLLAFCALLFASAPGWAADPIKLTIKDHRFAPSEVTVPAGERFRIEVENQDATPAEFESSDLRVEKIVVPGGRITVMAGPLKPGTYKFFDDYHPDLATGTLTAVEQKTEK
jgi:plastocyanin